MGFFNDVIGIPNIKNKIITGIVKNIPEVKRIREEAEQDTRTPEERAADIEARKKELEKNKTIGEIRIGKDDEQNIEDITGIELGGKNNFIDNIKEDIKEKIGIEEQGNNQQSGTDINGLQGETPSIEELWKREDAIRKETQQREDTAYQRAVEDMRKAGINPNLTGVNPANSGGGIVSATGQGLITTEMSGIINEAITEINNTVKANENQKDRITDIIRTLAMIMLLKK